jgi:hypothetical protein
MQQAPGSPNELVQSGVVAHTQVLSNACAAHVISFRYIAHVVPREPVRARQQLGVTPVSSPVSVLTSTPVSTPVSTLVSLAASTPLSTGGLHADAPLHTQVPPPSARLQRSRPNELNALQNAALAGLIARQQFGRPVSRITPESLQRASRLHVHAVPSSCMLHTAGPRDSRPSHTPWLAGENARQQEFDGGASKRGPVSMTLTPVSATPAPVSIATSASLCVALSTMRSALASAGAEASPHAARVDTQVVTSHGAPRRAALRSARRTSTMIERSETSSVFVESIERMLPEYALVAYCGALE